MSILSESGKSWCICVMCLYIGAAGLIILLLADATIAQRQDSGWISTLRLLQDGKSLVIGRNDGSIEQWLVGRNAPDWKLETKMGRAVTLWVSPDEKYAFVSTMLGFISVVDIAKGRSLATADLGGGLRDAAFSPNGRWLAVVQEGRLVNPIVLFDLQNAQRGDFRKLKTFQLPGRIEPDQATAVRFCDNASNLAAVTAKGYILSWPQKVWTENPEQEFVPLSAAKHVRRIGREMNFKTRLLGISCAGGLIATAGPYSSVGQIQLWDGNNAVLLYKIMAEPFEAHPDTARRVVFDEYGHLLLSTGTIFNVIWDVKGRTLKPLARLSLTGGGGLAGRRDFLDAAQVLGERIVIARGSDAFILDKDSFNVIAQCGDGPPLRVRILE